MKMNEVQLIGRLTKSPELKYINSKEGQIGVTNITIAVTRDRKNKQNQYEADFINCVIWGKAAENLCKYQKKGKLIAIMGSIQTSSYENNNGERVFKTEVAVRKVQYLEKMDSPKTNQHPSQQQPPEPPIMEEDYVEYEEDYSELPLDSWPPSGNSGRVGPEDIH
ncbi:single-stranded DNA-binding protein [Listeria monocytogenes]|uniref:single-stranded DNA-binding protein n=1 Tax=Listeria welshimeri TaxID=1643 RepID=UPI001625F7DF|nr:single-stranded DNA-binding protein [Listeria welshimeri]MBC1608885.1 single-stranded DNA-binding protein [Listeria welshimeri]MBC1631707.1 single-stranded DNA-binding protein [Listeria welshimeri]MBC1639913.1 single-stranded DNA-binding protein [Listeria welshimeri]MBC1670575.1 single-stranded DNA-binding protein [Listeria welshimeri]MBC2091918.1 single-stranded DNA-binding protein [Listeria welshimeri]